MQKKYKKRTDGRYETKVNVGFDPTTGRPIRVTVYGKSVKELELNKSEILINQRKGVNIAKRNLTFSDYKTIWLNSKKDKQRKTYEMYNRALKHCSLLDKFSITDITRMHIQSIIDANEDHPRTCQQIKGVLNQIFKLAIVDRLIYFNPVDGIVLPKYKANKKRALTKYENILSEITDFTDRERAYIYLIKYLGLRREEALALCISDFDMQNKMVTISKAITWDHNHPFIKQTKSEAGERSLYMTKSLYNFINYYISNLDGEFLFTNIKNDSLITETSFKRMWASIIKKMNAKADELNYPHCKGLTSHIFRHNFSTILSKEEIPLDVRMYMLGHSSINVTIDVYTHIEKSSEKQNKQLEVYWSKQELKSSKSRQTKIEHKKSA